MNSKTRARNEKRSVRKDTMQKILIFGNSGSGKSTFAEKLWITLGINVHHLDTICCDENYERLPVETVLPILQNIMNSWSWIIEGNYSSTLFTERIAQADTIIILETPLRVCLFRVIKRFLAIAWKKENRVGTTKNQKNSLSLKFLYWIIWRYPREMKTRMHEALALLEKRISIQRLRSGMDIEDFLKKITIRYD